MKYTYAYKTSDGARHEGETSPETWESKNEALRRIGLRTIANPKEQE